MEGRANRTPNSLAMLVRAACLCLGVLVLAACEGGSGGEGSAQANTSPPVATPPVAAPPVTAPPVTTLPDSTVPDSGTVTPPPVTISKPFVIVDAIRDTSAGTARFPGTVSQQHERVGGTVADAARVTLNGQPVDIAELHAGEVAVFRGTWTELWDRSGNFLGYDSVVYDSVDAHQVVVGAVDSVDPSRARLVVMGQQVQVTGDTVVDDVSVAAGGLGTVQPREMVAVSGFLAASGEILATRIAHHVSTGPVMLRGYVIAADPAVSRIQVGSLDVHYGGAVLQDFPRGLPNVGDQIVLLSNAPPTDAALSPHTVQFVPHSLDAAEGAEVVLYGIVTRRVAGTNFELDVGGVTASFECLSVDCGIDSQVAQLNMMVWLKGTLGPTGIVAGSSLGSIPGYSAYTWLTAPITAIDPLSGSLTVHGFHVQPLTVTQFAIRRGDDTTGMTADDLEVGDVVTSVGTYGGVPGLLIADFIVRDPSQDLTLYTLDFRLADPAISVLGRTILTTGATIVTRCGTQVETERLFSDVPYGGLGIGLAADASAPLEATWVSYSVFDYGEGLC